MRAYWILPNREQADDILASDGETVVPLRQILDPKRRPRGFSHGVPAELLERCGRAESEHVLFAQRFPDWNGRDQLFCLSCPAGMDAAGRVVHLGLMFILEPHERPIFVLPVAALPKEDQPYARALIHRMTAPHDGDSWAQSVRDLSEHPFKGPATNVELHRSAVRFHSLYEVGPSGLILKRTVWKSLATTVIFLMLFAVIGAYLSVRSCATSSRAAVQTGVIQWRFN